MFYAVYLLAAGSMCAIAAVGGANQHLKLYLGLDLGDSQGAAARLISLVLTCSIAGRLKVRALLREECQVLHPGSWRALSMEVVRCRR